MSDEKSIKLLICLLLLFLIQWKLYWGSFKNDATNTCDYSDTPLSHWNCYIYGKYEHEGLNIKTRKLEESSTDHVPVVVELRWREKTRQKKKTHTKENKEKVNMRC